MVRRKLNQPTDDSIKTSHFEGQYLRVNNILVFMLFKNNLKISIYSFENIIGGSS